MDGFALSKIAEHFGKLDAVALLRDASAREEAGDFANAVQLYTRAYRMWPELDSGIDDGLPRSVRAAAEDAGINCTALAESSLSMEPTPRFPVRSVDAWMAHLDEHGYCVIAGVADAMEVTQGKALMWDYLESIPGTQVRRTDASTWGQDDWLPSPDNGLLGGYGFGQSAFCWHTRLLPGVRQAFASIWDCDDLLVSFDGGNVFRPWEARPEWRTQGSWWHIDQNAFLPGKEGRRCVQGFVTFTDAQPATGGLCVAPGSHKQHRQVCERAYAQELLSDFVPVQAEDPVLASGGRLVCAKAGDLVLWDSRCVHCNTPGVLRTEGMEKATNMSKSLTSSPQGGAELLRVVGYVCMTPSTWASREVLDNRKRGFVKNVSTSHSPHEYQGAVEAPLWMSPNTWDETSEVQKRMIVGADYDT